MCALAIRRAPGRSLLTKPLMGQRKLKTRTKKPRSSYIYIGAPQPFAGLQENQDSFLLPNDGTPYWIFHQREYPRKKAGKRLYALFQFFGQHEIRKDPFQELRRYDRVFALDTNTRDSGDVRTSTTAVFEGLWTPGRRGIAPVKKYVESFEPGSDKPEREGWVRFLQRIEARPGDKCTLFVDSDLGHLIQINRMEEPVYGDYFLPEGWQLNYATSDASDPFPLVKMMRMCDRAAKPRAARK
jgi:hypothetical protein